MRENNSVINRVRLALLAMQRQSWEQGVAAQPFPELGDTSLVILMAKEAVLRQSEDGRLAIIGANHAVTDPGANGEPLLYARGQQAILACKRQPSAC